MRKTGGSEAAAREFSNEEELELRQDTAEATSKRITTSKKRQDLKERTNDHVKTI
ncbi:MAG: hypothetical protein K0R19_2132 [Bacillota bacterium]|jgi:hypothetical protein|nr:hypothetical protein [Bacillota bacterium]